MAVCLTEAYIVWHKQFKSIDFFLKRQKFRKEYCMQVAMFIVL